MDLSSYRVGIYTRESRDDNEENFETIETQRDLLIDFVEKNSLGKVFRVYMDDNASGSVFNRSGIDQLKEDVLSNRINLLVMKDLSRLGRNNAKTLLFLDFLEEYGIRVITLDGRYDSIKDNDTVGIETWFNERYIRDISKKIRTNLRFKIVKGEYIGHAPFGYKKSVEQRNRLCIDGETAHIVREIYALYKDGFGYSHIANILNNKGYPCPSVKHYHRSKTGLWNAIAVRRILCSRVYIGDTVQGISEKVSFKSKKTRRLPQSWWVITENTHEPIISREEFTEIQKIREGKSKGTGSHKGKIHLFKDVLFCGRCGSTMHARSRTGRPMGYICSSYGKKGKISCTSHYIREDIISKLLTDELLGLFNEKSMHDKLKEMIEISMHGKHELENEMLKLEQLISAKQRQQDILYLDKLEGKISESLFLRTNQNIENRINQLRHEIEKLADKKAHDLKCDDIISEKVAELKQFGITRELVMLLVSRIIIYDPGDNATAFITSEEEKKAVKANGAIVIEFKN